MPRGRRPVTAPLASAAICRTSRAAPAASFAAAFTRAAPISTSALAGGACAGVDGNVGDGGAPDEVWSLRVGGGRAALVASVEALRDRRRALGQVRIEQAERHTHDELRRRARGESL